MGVHEIKLIEKDTDIDSLKMTRYDWDVIVNDKPYFIVRIEGYNHAIRGYDEPLNVWAYPRDEKPCYNNLIPFYSKEPVKWGIIYNPMNSYKTRHGDGEIDTIGGVTITRNGVPFYTVGGGLNYGIDKARVLITQIHEHPIDLNMIDFDKKVVGRKVWYRSEPGIITRYINRQACVIIEPDGMKEFSIPAEYDNDEDRCIFDEDRDYIKDEIFSNHICWFRD